MAAVLAHRARDEKLSPRLTGHYLAIPLLCPQGKLPEKYRQFYLSDEQNKNAPSLPKPPLTCS
jgi:hypothetical protein